MKFLIQAKPIHINLALLLIRLGIGCSLLFNYGYTKISHPEKWHALGEKMALLHIHFLPAFWGFMAAFSEFFGSIFLMLGLFSRITNAMLAFTMLIAFLTGFPKNDFNSEAFELMIVFIALIFTGPGKFSIDARLGGLKK